jgi:hypothetical protein
LYSLSHFMDLILHKSSYLNKMVISMPGWIFF